MPPGVTLAPSSSTSQTRAGVGVLMGPWGGAGGLLPGAHGNLAAAVCVSVYGGGRVRGLGGSSRSEAAGAGMGTGGLAGSWLRHGQVLILCALLNLLSSSNRTRFYCTFSDYKNYTRSL